VMPLLVVLPAVMLIALMNDLWECLVGTTTVYYYGTVSMFVLVRCCLYVIVCVAMCYMWLLFVLCLMFVSLASGCFVGLDIACCVVVCCLVFLCALLLLGLCLCV
jgi:hypothetical protein